LGSFALSEKSLWFQIATGTTPEKEFPKTIPLKIGSFIGGIQTKRANRNEL